MKGYFIRKPANLNEVREETEIKKRQGSLPVKIKAIGKVTLTVAEFRDFQKRLYLDYDFIAARTKRCGMTDTEWSCILVTCKDSDLTIAVESEGYNYPRYAAIVID